MEAKIKQSGMKIMLQTSSVKMCDFCDLFRVYKWIDFALEKKFVHVSFLESQKPRSIKNLNLQILLPGKRNWRFNHAFLRSKDDSNHWNNKNEQVERSEKLFFQLLHFLSNSSKS